MLNPAPELLFLRNFLIAQSAESKRLVESLADNSVCTVQYDNAVPCVSVVWLGEISSLQFRFVHENVLDLIRRHSVNTVLFDDRLLPNITAEDLIWMTNIWLPRAVSAGLRAVATIVPAPYVGRLFAEKVEGKIRKSIRHQTFDSLEQGRRWLADL